MYSRFPLAMGLPVHPAMILAGCFLRNALAAVAIVVSPEPVRVSHTGTRTPDGLRGLACCHSALSRRGQYLIQVSCLSGQILCRLFLFSLSPLNAENASDYSRNIP